MWWCFCIALAPGVIIINKNIWKGFDIIHRHILKTAYEYSQQKKPYYYTAEL